MAFQILPSALCMDSHSEIPKPVCMRDRHIPDTSQPCVNDQLCRQRHATNKYNNSHICIKGMHDESDIFII